MKCNHNNILNAFSVGISLITQPVIFTIINVLDLTLEIIIRTPKQCTRIYLIWIIYKPIERKFSVSLVEVEASITNNIRDFTIIWEEC